MGGDFRTSLAPGGPALARLKPFRRRMVCLLVAGYTREEIAAMVRKKKHATDVTIRRAMEELGARSDVELVLLAYGLVEEDPDALAQA